MRETQLFCQLGIIADGSRIAAELCLGINQTDFQGMYLLILVERLIGKSRNKL
jgi:hypothetical protein